VRGRAGCPVCCSLRADPSYGPRTGAKRVAAGMDKGRRAVAAPGPMAASAGGDPARALLAVGARSDGGVGDELTGLQRSPERLHHLRHLAVDEPRHPLPLTSNRPRRSSLTPDGSRRPARASIAAAARPPGLASATTDAHPIKRPGRSPQPAPTSPVLRSPREPKDRQTDTDDARSPRRPGACRSARALLPWTTNESATPARRVAPGA
jgi:hypothetical protein